MLGFGRKLTAIITFTKIIAILFAPFTISSPTSSSIKNYCVHTCVCTPHEQENWTSDVVCDVTGDDWPGSYPHASSLTIRGHGVKELEKNVFKNARTSRIFEELAHLQRLTLSGCNITSIHPETFNGFTQLEVLDLSNNNISGLTEEHFKGINPTIILKGNDFQECIELRRKLNKRPGEKIIVVCGIHTPEPTPDPLSTLVLTTENSTQANLSTAVAHTIKDNENYNHSKTMPVVKDADKKESDLPSLLNTYSEVTEVAENPDVDDTTDEITIEVAAENSETSFSISPVAVLVFGLSAFIVSGVGSLWWCARRRSETTSREEEKALRPTTENEAMSM